MASKQQANAKIEAAIKDCKNAQKAWSAAHKSLSASVSTNGYGIYSGQGRELKGYLQDAQAQIKQALTALNEVNWPTDDDYDLV